MRNLSGPQLVLAACLAASSAAAQQPGQLAGANRPNLKVLQTLPEAQLFPLMNVIADGLGVRCDYCHMQKEPDLTRTPANVGGWVWANDDKATKRKAREMMQMVVDLNAKNFRGEARVTCFTCHQGTTRPARAVPLPPAVWGSGLTPAATRLPSIDVVWANYVSAVGQAATAPAGTGTIFSGWDERSEGRYGKVEVIVGADRYRLSLTSPQATTLQGLDSAGAWGVNAGRLARFTAAADLARVRRIMMRYQPVKERPANLRLTGIERINGRDAYVATAKLDSATTLSLYFDAVTGLLKREMTLSETVLLPLQEQVDYDDYRDVGGVQLPFFIRSSTGAAYDQITRVFLDIRRNVPVADSVYRPPLTPR